MFSENLKARRKAKGYTQEEVAIVVLNILSVIIFVTVPPTSSDVDNSVITEINNETVYEQ